MIDTKFNFYSEVRAGADPDQHSPTLRAYHKLLWSKQLPNGEMFELDATCKKPFLRHDSHLGEFMLTSDAITHSYRNTKRMQPIIGEVRAEAEELLSEGSTIGSYILFPGKRVGGKMTINGARGINGKIGDRFDLTLECIRLYYLGKESPLSDVFKRYDDFFRLFENFKGYVDFFLLRDLVTPDHSGVNFYLPFRGFDHSPFPQDKDEYLQYRRKTLDFISARGQRMLLSV